MSTRQTHLAGVLLVVLVLTAGCSGLLGEGPIEYAASNVTITDDAVSEAGFERIEERSLVVNRSVDVGNETRQVRITTYLSAYEKDYGNDSLGYVVALSTPKAQGLNPLGLLDRETLISRALSRARNVDSVDVDGDDIQEVSTETVPVLGSERNVTTYEATATRSGETTEVSVHLTRFEHGDDYVIAVGVYPQSVTEGGDDVTTMLRGIEHETDDGEE